MVVLLLTIIERVKTIEVSLRNEDHFGLAAVARYEEALQRSKADGVKVRGLILCSPHNPLGEDVVFLPSRVLTCHRKMLSSRCSGSISQAVSEVSNPSDLR